MLAIIIAMLGIMLMSGILSAFNSAITMAPFETRMVEFIITEQLKFETRNAAARVIAKAYRLYKVHHPPSSTLSVHCFVPFLMCKCIHFTMVNE